MPNGQTTKDDKTREEEMEKLINDLYDSLVPPNHNYNPEPVPHWEVIPSPDNKAEIARNIVLNVNWLMDFKEYADVNIPTTANSVESPPFAVSGQEVTRVYVRGPYVVFRFAMSYQLKHVHAALTDVEQHVCKLSGVNPEAYFKRVNIVNVPVHPACAPHTPPAPPGRTTIPTG